LNDSDKISQIYFVSRGGTYGDNIYSTGHTKEKWADGVTPDPTYKGGFLKLLEVVDLPTQTFNIADYGKLDSKNDIATITVPWTEDGYNVFFGEGDTRVRGYVNKNGKGTLSPDKKYNFIFYLRPEYINDRYSIWMKDDEEVAQGTSGAVKVIPIGYDSYYNTASIMKSQGVGNQPRHDLSDF
jgi:hypothetical protein